RSSVRGRRDGIKLVRARVAGHCDLSFPRVCHQRSATGDGLYRRVRVCQNTPFALRRAGPGSTLSATANLTPLFAGAAAAPRLVSIVIPVYNEAANLPVLWRRLEPVMSRPGYSW